MFERQIQDKRGKIQGRKIRALLFALASVLFYLSAAQAEPLPIEGGLSDPTEPPPNYQAKLENNPAGEVAGEPGRRWLLTSTLVSPQRRIAVMNGQAVKPGDVVDGVTVLDIALATVRLRDTQGEFSVTMQPAAVKTPSGRTPTPQP